MKIKLKTVNLYRNTQKHPEQKFFIDFLESHVGFFTSKFCTLTTGLNHAVTLSLLSNFVKNKLLVKNKRFYEVTINFETIKNNYDE